MLWVWTIKEKEKYKLLEMDFLRAKLSRMDRTRNAEIRRMGGGQTIIE
jgi:hypothetical protein